MHQRFNIVSSANTPVICYGHQRAASSRCLVVHHCCHCNGHSPGYACATPNTAPVDLLSSSQGPGKYTVCVVLRDAVCTVAWWLRKRPIYECLLHMTTYALGTCPLTLLEPAQLLVIRCTWALPPPAPCFALRCTIRAHRYAT
jgi:hypothetical protein